jgi:Gpi18-like mannosyltransferase
VSNILLLANFFSLYYVISRLYSERIALKAILLLFLFPFGIFYRSYFTEGLFLLLLTWFAYFLIRKKLFIAAIFTSLLFVARPNGSVMGLIFFYQLYKAVRAKKLSLMMAGLYTVLIVIPYGAWHYLCYMNAGDPFYWYHVQSLWYSSSSVLQTVWDNIMRVLTYWQLPLHEAHNSKVDTLIVILGGILLFKSKKFLKPQLWWISLLLWIFPLLLKDTMSFSRFQSVSFPLFIYLAMTLNKAYFIIVSAIFFILLCMTSIIFVNWYWVG